MYLDCHGMNICNHRCRSMDDSSNRLAVEAVVAAVQIQIVAIINKVVGVVYRTRVKKIDSIFDASNQKMENVLILFVFSFFLV